MAFTPAVRWGPSEESRGRRPRFQAARSRPLARRAHPGQAAARPGSQRRAIDCVERQADSARSADPVSGTLSGCVSARRTGGSARVVCCRLFSHRDLGCRVSSSPEAPPTPGCLTWVWFPLIYIRDHRPPTLAGRFQVRQPGLRPSTPAMLRMASAVAPGNCSSRTHHVLCAVCCMCFDRQLRIGAPSVLPPTLRSRSYALASPP